MQPLGGRPARRGGGRITAADGLRVHPLIEPSTPPRPLTAAPPPCPSLCCSMDPKFVRNQRFAKKHMAAKAVKA
jgi:hypothetical protein